MEGQPFLPLPEGLRIIGTCQEETTLMVCVLSEQTKASCPLCSQVSDVVHSHYQRTLRDVPCGGQTVRLRLTVRKFFCNNQACSRRIFTERLPTFVEPFAQMTIRLIQVLQAIGLSTSASLGARLAARLGIATSWMTILRRVMELPTSEVGTVSELGIDDFSFRRRRKFGTILVDLSSHQVIDLLPERSAESAAKWLRSHPEIQYVSRDRGKDYAQAASEGASQAVQISDRFHLMKNFVEAIEAEVSRCYKQFRHAHIPLPSPDLPAPDQWKYTADGDGKQKRAEKKIDKQEQFEQVKTLISQGCSALEVAEQLAIPVRRVYHWKAREDRPAGEVERPERTDKQEWAAHILQLRLLGLSHKEIAKRLAISVRTVQRWHKRRPDDETSQPRRKRSSIFDSYAPYVLSRWQQGERSVSLIFHEIQEQGFSGSIRTIYRFVRALRQDSSSLSLPAPRAADRVSVQKAIWLLVRPADKLKTDERTDVEELCQASHELAALHTLAQSFGLMVRGREGHRLDGWMKQVQESSFRHLKRFVFGLQRDKEEVLAGLTQVYSNGQVEGFSSSSRDKALAARVSRCCASECSTLCSSLS